jgi:hypothetical protein
MQRDMNLVRNIFLKVQGAPADSPISREGIVIDGYDIPVIQRHVDMLVDAGFLTVRADLPPANPVDRHDLCSLAITWSGYNKLELLPSGSR